MSCNRWGTSGEEEKAGDRQPPFNAVSTLEPLPPGDGPQTRMQGQSSDSLPFRSRPRTLPLGTLITIRLEHPLDSADVHAGDMFTATVAEPVMIGGDTLITRGSKVDGMVEGTAKSRVPEETGYIRLTLTNLAFEGKQVPLQTSSLFAPGTLNVRKSKDASQAAPAHTPAARGRRLTFRLNTPVLLDHPDSVANSKYSLPHAD
jgi:hypothetical protein